MPNINTGIKFTSFVSFMLLCTGCLLLEDPEFVVIEDTNEDLVDTATGHFSDSDGTCANRWTGDNCDQCPANWNAEADCAECAAGYMGNDCELNVVTLVTAESSDDRIEHVNLALNQNDFPGVSYLLNGALTLSMCLADDCSLVQDVVLDDGSDTRSTDVFFGDNNQPMVLDHLYPGPRIDVFGCADNRCSESTRTLETAFDEQFYSFDVAKSGLGTALVVALHGGDEGLFFVTCVSPDCSVTSTEAHDISYVPNESTIAAVKGNDDLVSVAFGAYDILTSGNRRIEFGRCSDNACAGLTMSEMAEPGERPNMVLGRDGLPFIAYLAEIEGDPFGNDLGVIHCEDNACTNTTVTKFETISGAVNYPGVTVGPTGYPIVAYSDRTGTLKLLVCSNNSCTNNRTISVAPNVHGGGIIQSNAAGRLVIAYIATDENALKLLFLTPEFIAGK